MKGITFKIIVVTVLLSIVLMGCSKATPEPTEPPAPVVVIEQPTAVPPTEAPTEEPTLAPTEAPTEAPTAEPTVAAVVEVAPAVTEATATPETVAVSGKAQVTAKADLNCRKYPMRNSNSLGYLKAGVPTNVLGKNVTEDWFLIPNPTNPGQMRCWVWTGGLDLNGDLATIEVFDSSVND